MTGSVDPTPTMPPFDDDFISDALEKDESYHFDCKRLKGKLAKILETIVAFANSDGGMIALGFEDPDKGIGKDRVYGVQENPMNWDELRRLMQSRITDSPVLQTSATEIGCTLRDGTTGSVIFLRIHKSSQIHSIIDDGTFIRLQKGNKELTAPEITALSFQRGVISAETQLEDIAFELLNTDFWRAYAERRKLTRPIDEAMHSIGLARQNAEGKLIPTRAAILLFAEEPSGILASKVAIRIFHYRGDIIQTDPSTNLLKTPVTVGGPVIRQIHDAKDAVIRELASGIQMGPLGFEIIQKYPVRVLTEAITNAVIHRDYRLPTDIHIRIFSDRIEVESPGLLVAPVTVANIWRVGPHSRNPLLIQHLREFPSAPNLDAGEGVRMMFGTMFDAGLYPPIYWTSPRLQREAVLVYLFNENRPSIWEQVSAHIDEHGWIANAEVRKLKQTEDTLKASKQLKEWIDLGLLVVANPLAGKRFRKYTKPDVEEDDSLFSKLKGK